MSKTKRGRDKFKKYKKIINLISKLYSLFPLKFRKKLFEHYRMKKGIKGLVIRYALLKTIAKSCGDNVSIHENVYMLHPENINIGNNVSIHPMCYLECGDNEGIFIGNDVSIAHGTSILSNTHLFNQTEIPIKDQGTLSKKVVIEEDVWIGTKVTILCGITIKKGSILGANTLVNKNVNEYSIMGGVPAKLLKKRK